RTHAGVPRPLVLVRDAAGPRMVAARGLPRRSGHRPRRSSAKPRARSHRPASRRAQPHADAPAQLRAPLQSGDGLFLPAPRWRWRWSGPARARAWLRRPHYLGDPAIDVDEAVRWRVHAAAGRRPAGPRRMLTHLRSFGHYFNPVTFYYCLHADGERLDRIVA